MASARCTFVALPRDIIWGGTHAGYRYSSALSDLIIGLPKIDRRRSHRKIYKGNAGGVFEAVDVPIGKAHDVTFPKCHRLLAGEKQTARAGKGDPHLLGGFVPVPRIGGARRYDDSRDRDTLGGRVLGEQQLMRLDTQLGEHFDVSALDELHVRFL